jgi:acyl carrier protein
VLEALQCPSKTSVGDASAWPQRERTVDLDALSRQPWARCSGSGQPGTVIGELPTKAENTLIPTVAKAFLYWEMMSAVSFHAGRLATPESDGDPELAPVHATLVEIIQTLFRVPTVRLVAETAYADIPGWDSLSQINVIFSVEQRLGIRFDDDELEELRAFTTLGELEMLVRTKLAARATQT